MANKGALASKGTIAAATPLVVTGLALATSASSMGSSYGATVSGSGLASQTYFDMRFRAPGSAVDATAFNWQSGPTASHTVGAGTTGMWTITGVRAHTDPADHTGTFVTVSVTLTIQ